MKHTRHVIVAATMAAVLVTGALAAAQTPQADRDEAVRQAWREHLAAVAAERGLGGAGGRLAGDAAAVTGAYREVIARTFGDPRVVAQLMPNPQEIAQLTQQVVTRETAERIEALRASGVDADMAKSINAASTNPIVAMLTERSGFSDFIGFALDSVDSLASDSSGVSVNLSGLLLAAMRDTEVYSAPEAYRRHDLLRRFGGTVSFGAKVPEKQITGFSGFPDFGQAFDVFVWDLKARVIGDRDPRSQRWWNELVGREGNLVQVVAVITALAGADAPIVAKILLEERLQVSAGQIRKRIASSLQVTVKTAGQHLTKEAGRDKYTFAMLLDKGVGPATITGNVLYTVVKKVDPLASTPYSFRDWKVAGAVTTTIAPNAIVAGRAIEISGEGRIVIPTDASSVPVDRSKIWSIGATIAVPWGASAKIPVSIVYTNDKDSLARQKQVVGQLGISYDFGSLKGLFGGG